MPDKFGWDNNFGNNPAPARHQKPKLAAVLEAGMQREALRPWCAACGWRKGGIDSWDGRACKCGHSEPPLRREPT